MGGFFKEVQRYELMNKMIAVEESKNKVLMKRITSLRTNFYDCLSVSKRIREKFHFHSEENPNAFGSVRGFIRT